MFSAKETSGCYVKSLNLSTSAKPGGQKKSYILKSDMSQNCQSSVDSGNSGRVSVKKLLDSTDSTTLANSVL